MEEEHLVKGSHGKVPDWRLFELDPNICPLVDGFYVVQPGNSTGPEVS